MLLFLCSSDSSVLKLTGMLCFSGALQQEIRQFVVVLKAVTGHIQAPFVLLDCRFGKEHGAEMLPPSVALNGRSFFMADGKCSPHWSFHNSSEGQFVSVLMAESLHINATSHLGERTNILYLWFCKSILSGYFTDSVYI